MLAALESAPAAADVLAALESAPAAADVLAALEPASDGISAALASVSEAKCESLTRVFDFTFNLSATPS